MGNLQKVVYLSESQAQELFTNETITVDGVTVNYSADDLYLTPDDSGNFVLKVGDTMTGALKAKGLRTYVSDTNGNASLNFGETADSTRLGRITMNTTTNIMEFDEGNERYLLPAPTASSETLYNILTSKTAVSVAQGGTGAVTATDALTNLGALPLAGGTMTGQIVLSSTGFKTSNAAGYSVNGYGNFIHTDTSTTSSWNICKNSGAGVFTVNFENGNTTVGGALTVNSTVQTSGDITIQGPTYPTFALKRTDGTALGSFYASANSGRVNIRTWNTAGTYYVDYGLPDDSDNDVSRARYFLTTKDFDFVNYSGTNGTMPGLVKSDNGIWLVSVYDSADAAKYWVGVVIKKASTNPVVQLFKNATITCSGGNTLGTLVFAGGSNYIAKALKIG